MADFTNIADSALDPDAPLTSNLAYAWRDNAIAIAEGSNGAPHVEAQWYPFDSVSVGDGNEGVIYDHATDGDVSSVESPDFVDGFEYEFAFEALEGTITTLNMELFRVTAGSYATAHNMHDGGAGTTVYGRVWLPTPRVASEIFSVHYINRPSAQTGNSTGALGAGDIGFRVTLGTAQKIGKVRFSGAADFTGGRILMRQRRVHV